jgi:DNA polymerase
MPEEQSACFSFLEAQIHILKPKMILCMGRISGHKLLNTEQSLRDLRGRIHDYNGIPLMVTYHPSALLRNEELKRPAWEDLKLFKKELDKINQK